jgi:hypothetical protein
MIRAIEWLVEKLERLKDYLWMRQVIRNEKKRYTDRKERESFNRTAPGPSYNCRCHVEPYPLTDKFIRWESVRDPRPNHVRHDWEQKPLTPEQILIVQKTERKVKKKKKLTAGKHGKKLQTTKRKNKQ